MFSFHVWLNRLHIGRLGRILLQTFFFLFLAIVILLVLNNLQINLSRTGLAPDLSFLWLPADFQVNFKLISYEPSNTIARVFLVALINTIFVAFCSIILATLIGILMGVCMISRHVVLRSFGKTYVEIFRNIPLLLQIFFWYEGIFLAFPDIKTGAGILWDYVLFSNRGFYFPDLSGYGWTFCMGFLLVIVLLIGFYKWPIFKILEKDKALSFLWIGCGVAFLLWGFFLLQKPSISGESGIRLVPEFLALMIALSTYAGAFIAEAVRAGFNSIPRGQEEAARSLSLPSFVDLFIVRFPQAMKVTLPAVVNQYLNVIKNSSLAAAISYPEIVSVFMGTVLNQTGKIVEVMLITMLTYLFFSLTTTLIVNLYARYLRSQAQ